MDNENDAGDLAYPTATATGDPFISTETNEFREMVGGSADAHANPFENPDAENTPFVQATQSVDPTPKLSSEFVNFQDHTSVDISGNLDQNARTTVSPVPSDVPLLDTPASAPATSKATGSFYHITYYRPYFDVNTSDVFLRARAALEPKRHWDDVVVDKPDLYGPFWISTTLIFSMAVTGNLASWLSFVGKSAEDEWVYDFRKVTLAATLVYGYVFLIPLILWLVFKFYETKSSLVQLWCNFGYGMVAFVPCSILCILPNEVLRWLLIAGAAAVAGNTIGRYVWFVIQTQMASSYRTAKALPIMAFLGGSHFLLAMVLKLYFFEY